MLSIFSGILHLGIYFVYNAISIYSKRSITLAVHAYIIQHCCANCVVSQHFLQLLQHTKQYLKLWSIFLIFQENRLFQGV